VKDKVEAFNTVSKVYDDWYNHPQGRQVFQAEKNAIEEMIPNKGLGLEIGAGTGVFAESLKNEGRTILCLDPSPGMLSKARARRLHCILGVGDLLPFRRSSIDFSYMVTVLEFVDEPIALLREIGRNTRKETPLVVLFINSESSWGDLYRRVGDRGDIVFRHARLFTLEEMKSMLLKAGYVLMDALGTLVSSPTRAVVDQNLVEPSDKCGVIVIKAIKPG